MLGCPGLPGREMLQAPGEESELTHSANERLPSGQKYVRGSPERMRVCRCGRHNWGELLVEEKRRKGGGRQRPARGGERDTRVKSGRGGRRERGG